jgi:hypothetical protein
MSGFTRLHDQIGLDPAVSNLEFRLYWWYASHYRKDEPSVVVRQADAVKLFGWNRTTVSDAFNKLVRLGYLEADGRPRQAKLVRFPLLELQDGLRAAITPDDTGSEHGSTETAAHGSRGAAARGRGVLSADVAERTSSVVDPQTSSPAVSQSEDLHTRARNVAGLDDDFMGLATLRARHVQPDSVRGEVIEGEVLAEEVEL